MRRAPSPALHGLAATLTAILAAVALAACGGGSARTIALSGAQTAAGPSPTPGSTSAAYPPADPALNASCPRTDGGFCVQGAGVRVRALAAGEACAVRIDPPGVRSGRWRALRPDGTLLGCGPGAAGSVCAIAAAPGRAPTPGRWDATGGCVTRRRGGGACAVDQRTFGVWRQAAGGAGALACVPVGPPGPAR